MSYLLRRSRHKRPRDYEEGNPNNIPSADRPLRDGPLRDGGMAERDVAAIPANRIEHAEPSVAEITGPISNAATDEFPAEHIEQIDYKEKLTFFASHATFHGTTIEELKRIMMLIEVSTGKTAEINVADISRFLADLQADLRLRTHIFCNSCTASLPRSKLAVCGNSACSLYGIPPKRSKALRRPTLTVLDVRPQLETVLSNHLSLLINIHRDLHEKRIDSGRRAEAVDFPIFKNFCESESEFSDRKITIQVTISTDGFTPARLSRQEVWPLYIRIDDFPSKIGNNFLNILLAGILWTPRTPREELWEVLWSHVIAEVTILNSNELLQIRDKISGDTWTVKVHLSHAVIDYKGLQEIFGLPKWNSRLGCHKCTYPGNFVEGRLNWFCSSPLIYMRRTSENIVADAEANRNGLRKKTSAMKLFTPAHCSADALHVISEGVTKDRLRDILFRSSKIPEMRLAPEAVKELNTTLMRVSNYTYNNKFILCNEDLPELTGAEIDMFANVIFPLVGAFLLCPSALASASLVGYWYCLRELQAVEELTVTKIHVIQSVMTHVKKIWGTFSHEVFTLKTHNLLDHCIVDEIERYGSPYIWSAAPFEATHRILQIPHNQCVTNSNARILTRFVTMKKLVPLLREAAERNHSPHFAKLLNDMRNEEKRFPVHVYIAAACYVPKYSEVKIDTLSDEHRMMFYAHHRGLHEVHLYSRLVVNGKILSSKIYWQRNTSTNASTFQLRVSSADVIAYTKGGMSRTTLLNKYMHQEHSMQEESGSPLDIMPIYHPQSTATAIESSGLNVFETNIERTSEFSDSSQLGLAQVYAPLEPVRLQEDDIAQRQDIPESTISNQNGWRDAPGVEPEAGSLPFAHYTQASLPSDALDAVRSCLSREIVSFEFTSSLYAIIARGQTLPQSSLQETLHHCTRQIQRITFEDIYKLVRQAERSRLGTLYDNIETTRLLVENALSTRIQENLLLAKIRELEAQVNLYKQMFNKRIGEATETSATTFTYENLKGQHVIKQRPPFKETLLNDMLKAYAPTNRVKKHKTVLVITEFMRTIFKQICAPDPSDIWEYAHRTSNISRKAELQDLPESVVITLTDFVLDALNLGCYDLQGYRLNALKNSRDSYWLSLGDSDEEREKNFNSLLEKKSFWSVQIGICISEALEDIRYYRLHKGKLIPGKKYRSVQNGFGREEKAQMSKQDWRRLALHCT